MMVMLSYDITDNRTRSKFHRFLKEFGLNSQKSVFECLLDQEGITRIISFAKRIIDPKTDSVRIYRICSRCCNKVVLSGQGMKITQLDYRII